CTLVTGDAARILAALAEGCALATALEPSILTVTIFGAWLPTSLARPPRRQQLPLSLRTQPGLRLRAPLLRQRLPPRQRLARGDVRRAERQPGGDLLRQVEAREARGAAAHD